MEVLIVGIGGILGSLSRFILGRKLSNKLSTSFPWPTFLINISGAILLGAINSLDISRNAYVFFADGFLGAYTTFSTFMYEGFSDFSNKKSLNAFIYIFTSVVLGILGYLIGFWCGEKFI